MNTSKTSILILDDEPIVSKRLHPALEKKGYEVESFIDSSKALERIHQRNFDIVVTDLKMDGVDGMQFMTEVKSLSPDTEVIIITGFATMGNSKGIHTQRNFRFSRQTLQTWRDSGSNQVG